MQKNSMIVCKNVVVYIVPNIISRIIQDGEGQTHSAWQPEKVRSQSGKGNNDNQEVQTQFSEDLILK